MEAGESFRGVSMVRAPWGRGGGRLGSSYARMCVSKSEGHGSFFSFNGVK